MSKERILVTSALPYANGDIHLGYLVEAIQTDIYVRFQQMKGNECIYVCASDCHGSPIELKARKLGVSPEELAAGYQKAHLRDLKGFLISLDAFHTTHSEETRKHLYAIYDAAKAAGLIFTKDVDGLYSPSDGRFLPDRWVKGSCPNCGARDQYGDSCEVCGATYSPIDLGEPYSAISGGKLEVRSSPHVFYQLSATQPFLEEWVRSPGRVPEATRRFVQEWLGKGLQDWDISRDAPYFGFPIPDEEGKFFYVWVDAPVGYIGATEYYCAQVGARVEDYWKNPDSKVVHVIGKDIVYFHCLFWPSMLHTAGYNTPEHVQVHGFLSVNGEKMSKSRGTFINASTYLKHLDPEYLRFLYASKIRSEPTDLDLNVGAWTDPDDPASLDSSSSELVERVNAEFVNNIANFCSRVIQFLNKRLDSRLGPLPAECRAAARRIEEEVKPKVARAFDSFDHAAAMRLTNELALEANKYFQDAQPWKVVKEDAEAARAICTIGANYVKVLTGFLRPVVPTYAAKVEKALKIEPIDWEGIRFDLSERSIGEFENLVTRVDPEAVKAIVMESRESLSDAGDSSKPHSPPIKPEITIDEFLKVDLRTAEILEAEAVEKADKLVRLTIDLGEPQPRTIFAGIKKHYRPEDLKGRRIVVVANLKPRKMRFGTSQGMLLAATDESDVLLLDIDGEPASGSSVG